MPPDDSHVAGCAEPVKLCRMAGRPAACSPSGTVPASLVRYAFRAGYEDLLPHRGAATQGALPNPRATPEPLPRSATPQAAAQTFTALLAKAVDDPSWSDGQRRRRVHTEYDAAASQTCLPLTPVALTRIECWRGHGHERTC